MQLLAILEPLAINAATLAIAFAALWLIAIRIRDVSFIDAWWALGMTGMALSMFIRTGPPTPHRIALTALCVAWGVRLGLHLLRRWRREGPDRRYVELLAHAKATHGWGFPLSALVFVFALQAPLQFIVALPVQLGQLAPTHAPLGPLALAGLAIGAVGFLFETVGDLQLAAFKRDPSTKGKVLERGLWRYTRHPNYFGDACVWVGLYLIAAETPFGAWSFPGPLLLIVLLTRWSGAPLVEGRLRQSRPGYADYVRRTSAFIPWPPKNA
jgi:steroid 5-alpha reductase family enzyme